MESKSNKIINPETNRSILIGGTTYNKLITQYEELSLPTDLLYNDILLSSDIKTIKNLCLTNKNFFKICNNKMFWITIFERDFFVIDNDLIKDINTINDVIKLYEYGIEVNNIFKIIELKNIKSIETRHIKDNIKVDKLIRDKFNINEKNNPYSYLHIKINNDFSAEIRPNTYGISPIHYSYEEFLKLMVKILYYFPNVKIFNSRYYRQLR